MRQFANFPEALNELKRELAEMGIRLRTKSVQNIDISENPDYDMLEVSNYTYVVTAPEWEQIPLENKPYFEAEFQERVSGKRLNPGEAWKLDFSYWEPFLKHGMFDYAYSERMTEPLESVIKALREDPNTRRAYLSIFDPVTDEPHSFDERIPCSLGYHFMFREGQLNITYLQRSADFSKHFNKDIALADRLKCYVAQRCDMKPGYFCHWLGSLHIFAKDVKGVF
jgi:thymidylate synthase